MSNKIVPSIYRTVIDEVISSIKPEFEEYGVSEEILASLQEKWEKKVIDSGVAEFESQSNGSGQSNGATNGQQAAAQAQPPPPHPYMITPTHFAPGYPTHPQVKTEPSDNRYLLNTQIPMQMPYTLPSLPGPALNPHTGVLHFQPPTTAAPPKPSPTPRIPQVDGPSGPPPSHPAQPSTGVTVFPKIPQVDGPGDTSPPPPRSMHPSLPQPVKKETSPADDEAINSDLDDSDEGEDEDEPEALGADSDIVFCTYDKVARVKNKWKCILKDGMIHINGRDYLFQKCTGEFEW